jgi:hypothetical protein
MTNKLEAKMELQRKPQKPKTHKPECVCSRCGRPPVLKIPDSKLLEIGKRDHKAASFGGFEQCLILQHDVPRHFSFSSA